ncbi:MAG: hypothetical protein WC243_01245 [Patescibacteria group bacterium]|jgi:hypothetical protein
MKTLISLTSLTVFTTLLLIATGISAYRAHNEAEKDLIEKSTPINGKINTEFLDRTFGPADE